ncbi:MAG: hypothetical protein LBN08_01195 [Lactobacillales bacterium]|jgi:hypothetical protein|nr:hypothetical protein [Lactobacillales bacterium]
MNTFQIISIACFVIAALFIITAVVLFFKLNVMEALTDAEAIREAGNVDNAAAIPSNNETVLLNAAAGVTTTAAGKFTGIPSIEAFEHDEEGSVELETAETADLPDVKVAHSGGFFEEFPELAKTQPLDLEEVTAVYEFGDGIQVEQEPLLVEKKECCEPLSDTTEIGFVIDHSIYMSDSLAVIK